MKFTAFMPALVAGLCLTAGGATAVAGAASAAGVATATDDNMIGLTTPNGRLAYDFIDLWFNQRKPAEAFDKYVSRDDYVNHAVYSASVNKKENFEQEKADESRAMGDPSHRFQIVQLIAQGSLVFAHIHVIVPGAPGNELVMILRIRNGKITDHWDLHEKLRADSAVFTGLDR